MATKGGGNASGKARRDDETDASNRVPKTFENTQEVLRTNFGGPLYSH